VYDLAKDGKDSFAYYIVRYWLTDLPHDDATSSRVRARIYTALKRASIPLARPAQTFFFRADDEEQKVLRDRLREVEALKGLELFKGLTDEEVLKLTAHLRFAPFTEGETITKKGTVAHRLYILTRGRVEVLASVKGGRTKSVASIEAPGFFGEMGLMTGEPRSADVIARTDVE